VDATTSDPIEIYREWQRARSLYGDTHYAADLFFELCKRIESDPFLDREGFEAVMERLHRAAWPDAKGRPARLAGGDLIDPRE
jgi:hypothetical protein